jgi:hypothetical protein
MEIVANCVRYWRAWHDSWNRWKPVLETLGSRRSNTPTAVDVKRNLLWDEGRIHNLSARTERSNCCVSRPREVPPGLHHYFRFAACLQRTTVYRLLALALEPSLQLHGHDSRSSWRRPWREFSVLRCAATRKRVAVPGNITAHTWRTRYACSTRRHECLRSDPCCCCRVLSSCRC